MSGRRRENFRPGIMYPMRSHNILRNVVRSTCRIYYILLTVLVLLPRQTTSDCSLKFEEYKARRISALRFQILTKLGFTEPPPKDQIGPVEVPYEIISLYNETVSLIEERYASKHCSKSNLDDDDEEGRREYFAKVPIIITAENIERTGHGKLDYSIYFEESKLLCSDTYANARRMYARFFSFNISALDNLTIQDVDEVKLRLYQIRNPDQTMGQVISIFKLVKTPTSYMTKHIFTRTFDPQQEGPVSIDVTDVVHSWMMDPDSNHGFEVSVECSEYRTSTDWTNMEIEFADPVGSYTATAASSSKRGDMPMRNYHSEDKHPKLIVMTSHDHSELLDRSSGSSRRKRYSSQQCDDSVTSCCKRELYVNFKKDLGWTWIRQPKGFYPNFCAGNCLYIQTDSMYHHVLKFYRNTNPTASPSPCCSPMSFKPLTVLYYEKSRPQIATLQDVVVNSCRCS